jgi:hypothetical protein
VEVRALEAPATLTARGTWWRRQWDAWWPPAAYYLGCAAAAAVVFLPVAVERAIERVHFADRLGTFPVEVTLCHNGRSTLDTGIFGRVFWGQTGAYGFGAYARATGPPEAGGTLASYVDPAFIQANVALIDDPDYVVRAYSHSFAARLRQRVLAEELAAAVVGGAALVVLLPRRRWRGTSPPRAVALASVVLLAATGVSSVMAVRMFDAWPCNEPVTGAYQMPGMDRLSFASPQTREVAEQVRPFLLKNIERTRSEAAAYEAEAARTFAGALVVHRTDLVPRRGEAIVLAEADPQGSFVGVHVRASIYAALRAALGPDAIALRTISGDVTSNGTIAETRYLAAEAGVVPDLATVAVGGDHDSTSTWKQLADAGVVVPDLEAVDVGGLRVAGANDAEHKSLFGGIVTDDTGVTEQELGERLRTAVGERPSVVLVHQPEAALAYLGLGSLDGRIGASRTTPYDDGVPDVPPGILSFGHLHQAAGPWVLWNTDTAKVTWTLVDQLGTAGGVENRPTFNRFSTPTSPPLRPLMVRLQYVDRESRLATGYATITCDVGGRCTISDRVDVGLPGGQPIAAGRRSRAS